MEIVNTDFENWGCYLIKQFQCMFEKKERCDLEISCHKQIFLVHRLVMAACSDYVRELGDEKHIILPEEVSCKTLKTVIDFVYSGKIVFYKEDKEDLLTAASLLNMRLLTELIEREDPSSYTISMDENDEYRESESINFIEMNASKTDSEDISSRKQPPNFGRTTNKRKSDAKPYRSKSLKKNCLVLPSLHQFPYLQQKFSGTRTYGLITSLTSPVPSRFEISDAELQASSYRSTFHDVTYNTKRLYSDPNSLRLLEQSHVQFLEKLKDVSGYRRNHINALYSPFDKYTPPCGLKTTDSVNFQRSNSVVSYPSKTDTIANIRKYQVNNASHSKEVSCRSSTAIPVSPLLAMKEYKRLDVTKSNFNNSTNDVERHVHFSNNENVGEMNVPNMHTINRNLRKLPDSVPLATVQGTAVFTENNRFNNLIKLNNIESTNSPVEKISSSLACKENSDTPIFVIPSRALEVDNITPKTYSVVSINETMDVEESQVSTVMNTITALPNSIKPNFTPVSSDLSKTDSTKNSSSEEKSSIVTTTQNSKREELQSKEKILQSTIVPNSILPTAVDRISTDGTIFTTLSANTNNVQITSELNSQVIALKVKDSKNSTQLNKLVDMCKNNSLFKNKSSCFKIVPMKGTPMEKLKETILINNGISKAILVKQARDLSHVNVTASSNKSPSVTPTSSKSLERSEEAGLLTDAINIIKNNATISTENVNGPWICKNCGPEPLTFGSYYNYRTHLHTIHKESNNPVYCMHCGYKSLKRNMQLYHLFVKHNVTPPSYIKFPKCDKCEFYALNEHYLQKHLICHPSTGMEYVCSCKVAFKSSDLLQKHMVSGDCKNSRSFTCGYCRCTFDRFVNLKAHMRICMKERSKPMQENSSYLEFNAVKTISDGGKDYLAL